MESNIDRKRVFLFDVQTKLLIELWTLRLYQQVKLYTHQMVSLLYSFRSQFEPYIIADKGGVILSHRNYCRELSLWGKMTDGSHRICLKLWLVKLLFTKLVYPYTAPRVQQLADIYKYFLKFILQNSTFFLKYISINS